MIHEKVGSSRDSFDFGIKVSMAPIVPFEYFDIRVVF